MDTLQEFDFDIVHRLGKDNIACGPFPSLTHAQGRGSFFLSKDNIVADAMSRRPDYSTPERSLLLLELTGDDDLLARIRSLAAADPTYQRVANAV